MTNADDIIRAVCELFKKGIKKFTRKDVRDQLGLSAETWSNQYTAIFQAMRDDHDGSPPQLQKKYRDLFHRISRGIFILTSKGKNNC